MDKYIANATQEELANYAQYVQDMLDEGKLPVKYLDWKEHGLAS